MKISEGVGQSAVGRRSRGVDRVFQSAIMRLGRHVTGFPVGGRGRGAVKL